MSTSNKISAVIIDDMELARESLKADLVEHCPEIQLLDEADSVVSGLKLLKRTTPDIIFLDIELEDGIGFDIIDLLGDELKSKVIFTTASNEYAIRAFQVSAIDYLMKPIDPILLKEAIQKTKAQIPHSKDQLDLLSTELKTDASTDRIALHTQEKIVIAKLNSIIRCEASGNYTTIYLQDEQKVMVTKTLKEYNDFLPSSQFLRTHQSHLVNVDQVSAFVKTEGGYLVMNDESRVPVSVRKRQEVIKHLDGLR